MAEHYTVNQGDHVAGIASRFGFTDYRTIRDHPNNQELKNKRQNPNVLFPGDVPYVPDREGREEARPTDQRHRFVARRKPLKLHLKLRDHYEKPIANARCVLMSMAFRASDQRRERRAEAGDSPLRGPVCTGHQGHEQTPYGEIAIPVNIGHLDPVDEMSGQQGRLSNRGLPG